MLSGLAGLILLIISMTRIKITGAVIGANLVSMYLSIFGLAVFIIALIIEKKEFRKKK